MEYLVEAATVLTSVGVGWTLRWLLHACPEIPFHACPKLEPVWRAVPSPGEDGNKAYVRFTFANGQVDVRKMKSTDFDLLLEWRGRVFEAAEWTEDGHVFREIVSGR